MSICFFPRTPFCRLRVSAAPKPNAAASDSALPAQSSWGFFFFCVVRFGFGFDPRRYGDRWPRLPWKGWEGAPGGQIEKGGEKGRALEKGGGASACAALKLRRTRQGGRQRSCLTPPRAGGQERWRPSSSERIGLERRDGTEDVPEALSPLAERRAPQEAPPRFQRLAPPPGLAERPAWPARGPWSPPEREYDRVHEG